MIIRSLFRKELRALQPFIVLLGVLIGVDLIYLCLTEFPDNYGIIHWDGGYDIDAHLILFGIVAYALAQGLLMRERAEDTLEFLDALPVTRTSVFITKCCAAVLVISVFVVLYSLLYFALHLWSLDSSSTDIYPHFWWPRLVILLWMNLVYLCIGLAASFIGRFGLVLIGFLLLAVFVLRENGFAIADRIDPFAVSEISVVGTRVVIPWTLLLWQAAIGASCLVLAYFSYLRLSRPRRAGGFWKYAALPIFIVSCLFIFGAFITATIVFMDEEELQEAAAEADDTQVPEPVYPEFQTTRARTDDFVFIYPNNRAKKAEGLIANSAATHDKVVDFLQAKRRNGLVIDLTSNSPRHAGTAYWKRIRMNLNAGDTTDELDAILGHELTHVYIDQMSENKVSERFNTTRFFHEGLASYIEYRFFRPTSSLKEIRRLAAAAYDRDQVRFEILIDSTALSSRYTSEWVYPLGEVFIAGVVERFGDDAPQKLIRAFAREDAPKGLRSITLWQDTFQACGYNLEEAIAAFYALLDTEANETQRTWLDSIPRLDGEIVRDGDQIGIRITEVTTSPSADATAGKPLNHKKLVCRFRSTATTPDNEYRGARADEDGIARVPAENFTRGAFWYQIGYYDEDLMFPIFDPWVRGRLPEEPGEQ